MSFLAVSLWGAFMLGAIFYTQEARHPDTKPLTAYLAFATMFTLIAAAIFGGLVLLVQTLDADDRLEHPLAMLAVHATVFVPAVLRGRRQTRRLPRRRSGYADGDPRKPIRVKVPGRSLPRGHARVAAAPHLRGSGCRGA